MTNLNLNVIFFMADDLGFEALVNGADDYNTHFFFERIENFTSAYSQPLCTPTRVKIILKIFKKL